MWFGVSLEIIATLTSGWLGIATGMVIGTLFGFIAGLVPGIGGRIGLLLCLPFATFWDPLGGAVFLFAMHSVVHTAASIPAIAFALPSTAADAATVLDGYPLAKQGRGGEALGASLSASAIGGVLGALAFLIIIPVARPLMVWFGPPEFLLLALIGLSMVVLLSGGKLLTGLLVGLLGFLAAMVGLDVHTSAHRFTFGVDELFNGLNVVALIGGLFVVPEMLVKVSMNPQDHRRAIETDLGQVLIGMGAALSHMRLILRSSLYGIVIGIMPGLGSSVSVWMSYAWASKNIRPSTPFGEGAIEGVIAPEAANNSKEGGAMVPTLFFGIPGSSSMAIMLSALFVIGLPVGPSLLEQDLDIPLVLALTVVGANIIAIPVFFGIVPFIVRLAALRREQMIPIAVSIGLFAALYQQPNLSTLAQFVLGAALGLTLKWLSWPRAPFLLGFVLGPLAEISFIQTSQIWGWSMFLRPASLLMLAVFLIAGFRILRTRSTESEVSMTGVDLMLVVPILLIFVASVLAAWNLPRCFSGTYARCWRRVRTRIADTCVNAVVVRS